MEKAIQEIANENKQLESTSTNVDMTELEISASKELSETDKINAFYAYTAIKVYCKVLGKNEEKISQLLNQYLLKESGVYWLYTCPVFNEKTREVWEEENKGKGVIFVEKILNNFWYKRPFVISNANSVKNLVNGWDRFKEDRKSAEERKFKKLSEAAKLLGVTLDDLLMLQK